MFQFEFQRYFVGLRVGQAEPLPNSTKGLCDHCQAEVWISPGNEELAATADRVLCLECTKREVLGNMGQPAHTCPIYELLARYNPN